MSASTLSPTDSRVRPGRVLVLDDSAFFRGLLAEALKADGHEILEASDPECLEELLDGDDRPDLVLLDLGLPGRQVRRLLKLVRDRLGPDQIPVLALTEVVASPRDLDRLARLGCAGVLNKLAPPDHLRFRVRAAMYPAAREERSRLRVALSLPLRYRVVGEPRFARTHTVSPDGLFIRCAEPPPLGSTIELEIELGNPPRTLLTLGEVVRFEGGVDPHVPRGFGLRFTQLSLADRAALTELLDRVHERGL